METGKTLFAKGDSLVDKNFPSSGIKLSNSQTFISDGAETGMLLSDYALSSVKTTQTFTTFTLLHLTLQE